jgi:hypothetical protein
MAIRSGGARGSGGNRSGMAAPVYRRLLGWWLLYSFSRRELGDRKGSWEACSVPSFVFEPGSPAEN